MQKSHCDKFKLLFQFLKIAWKNFEFEFWRLKWFFRNHNHFFEFSVPEKMSFWTKIKFWISVHFFRRQFAFFQLQYRPYHGKCRKLFKAKTEFTFAAFPTTLWYFHPPLLQIFKKINSFQARPPRGVKRWRWSYMSNVTHHLCLKRQRALKNAWKMW